MSTPAPWLPKATAVLRIAMSWIFLWPFLDKTFGLKFATAPEAAWIKGGSPTEGFLKFGADPDGPLHGMFDAMAGSAIVDWLFMLGLLGIGLALLLGVGMRVAAGSGVTLLMLMWLAIMPMDSGTDHNPFLDDHIVYAAVLVVLALAKAGDTWGLGTWWKARPFVQKNRWME